MRIASICCLGCLLVGCTASDDMPAPRLSSVVPSHASPGTSITVFGDHLCQQPDMSGDDDDPLACANTGLVDFNSVPGSVETYTDTSVAAVVPDLPAGSVDVAVAVLGRRTNGVELRIETTALR